MNRAEDFFSRELEQWPDARARYRALDDVAARRVTRDGLRAQFNPARAVSTGARIDAAAIKARPCFLCPANRPQQQTADRGIFPGYELLVNPFPIFRRHFTIAATEHVPQSIAGRGADMYAMARELSGYAVFYNGARCGASAPDHMHVQAVPDELPFMLTGRFPFLTFRFTVSSPGEAQRLLDDALRKTAPLPGQPQAPEEPMVNVLAHSVASGVTFYVIPRKAHRPDFYGTGEGQMLISPASVDLAGVIITPRREDYDRLDAAAVQRLFSQVCYPAEPVITVGVMEAPEIKFRLNGPYTETTDADGTTTYTPESPESTFTLRDVVIGKGFHWERREDQQFAGSLTLLRHGADTIAVNTIPLEEYLKSVISSEMSASASPSLLQAHAIVSRSWLLSMLRRTGGCERHSTFIPAEENPAGADEIVAWHDREEHTLFDVCADDHCQRYQGVTRQTTPAVAAAVEATRGLVLTYGGEICDARFSKCCGGVTELFQNCWEPVSHPYLTSLRDRAEGGAADFCDTRDPAILSQILNDYDREHPDFYRWEAFLPADKLPQLLLKKTGVDFGPVKALTPIERGASGRINRLLIDGERCSLIIGKELEIRLALSESCLRSSAFDVEPAPDGFLLRGRGWGHGVGMCQIGAAVMGAQGYTWRQIVNHYFPDAEITRLYD